MDSLHTVSEIRPEDMGSDGRSISIPAGEHTLEFRVADDELGNGTFVMSWIEIAAD